MMRSAIEEGAIGPKCAIALGLIKPPKPRLPALFVRLPRARKADPRQLELLC